LAVPPTAARRLTTKWPGRAVVAIELSPAARQDVRAALVAAAWVGATPVPTAVLAAGAGEGKVAKALDELGAAVRAAGGGGVSELRVRCGDPAEEIVAEATRVHAGLVIARRRPSRGLFRFLRRSTTTRALHRLSVPLLVLPPEGVAWIRRLQGTRRA
jgi:nucleotide-binding universal stress UspA family protein